MKLLLDTNVVLDYFGVNEGFSDAAEEINGKDFEEQVIPCLTPAEFLKMYIG